MYNKPGVTHSFRLQLLEWIWMNDTHCSQAGSEFSCLGSAMQVLPHTKKAERCIKERYIKAPLTSRSWRASERPSMVQPKVLDLSRGTTRHIIGMGGLYFATRAAVLPVEAKTTIMGDCRGKSYVVDPCWDTVSRSYNKGDKLVKLLTRVWKLGLTTFKVGPLDDCRSSRQLLMCQQTVIWLWSDQTAMVDESASPKLWRVSWDAVEIWVVQHITKPKCSQQRTYSQQVKAHTWTLSAARTAVEAHRFTMWLERGVPLWRNFFFEIFF